MCVCEKGCAKGSNRSKQIDKDKQSTDERAREKRRKKETSHGALIRCNDAARLSPAYDQFRTGCYLILSFTLLTAPFFRTIWKSDNVISLPLKDQAHIISLSSSNTALVFWLVCICVMGKSGSRHHQTQAIDWWRLGKYYFVFFFHSLSLSDVIAEEFNLHRKLSHFFRLSIFQRFYWMNRRASDLKTNARSV